MGGADGSSFDGSSFDGWVVGAGASFLRKVTCPAGSLIATSLPTK